MSNPRARIGIWFGIILVLMGLAYWTGKQRVLSRQRGGTSGTPSSSASAAAGFEGADGWFDYVAWTKRQSLDESPWLDVPISDFASAQQRARDEFRKRHVFAYDTAIHTIAATPVETKDDYSIQEWHAQVNGKRVFRYFKLRPTNLVRDAATVVVFMGHGKVEQVLSGRKSYQRAAASELAQQGYVVYAMENVAMGPTDSRDTHLALDSVLSLTGHTWYSLLFAHQLFLLDVVFDDPEVDANAVGVAGVSTGGLLALSAAALDPRVRAASVHGIFASLADSFGRDHAEHCRCGSIDGLLPHFDLPELAVLVAPRPLHFNNNQSDGFPPSDAKAALRGVRAVYERLGAPGPIFTSPKGKHSFATREAMTFLEEALRRDEAP